MSASTTWSLAEDKILVNKRAAGESPKQLGDRLGRTARGCISRLQWHGAYTIENAKRIARENKYGQRYQIDTGMQKSLGLHVLASELCPSTVAAWDAHFQALARQRDLTSRICGDPLPGRSALDQNRNKQPAITLPSIEVVGDE